MGQVPINLRIGFPRKKLNDVLSHNNNQQQ